MSEKVRHTITVPEDTDRRFQRYAEETNRSYSEFLVEAGEQMIKRYAHKKTESLEKRLRDLIEEASHLYDTVR